MDGGYKKLKVYRLAHKLALEIFEVSKKFPKEEAYSLTGQIGRASRSVCTNIVKGYRKRIYPKHFKSKMTDADAEASEAQVWLEFAEIANSIKTEIHQRLYSEYLEVGKMLGYMIKNPQKFLPKS